MREWPLGRTATIGVLLTSLSLAVLAIALMPPSGEFAVAVVSASAWCWWLERTNG